MISQDVVKKVARLAKLSINENEIERYTVQLGNIMDMISQMDEADTSAVSPMTSVCSGDPVMRHDIVTDGNIVEDLFQNAPGKTADFAKEIKCFIVPKVVE
ncbi:MAG: Asp-tRNA(Asn)/Glu-tRNA(Gln) amidotransferase subunit GatC [Rickettsiaceae bacterium]|nr:Asp-tRNA(Asn)/Glu-tRNA(Gln) amidotransferase subunit GatC [Rickettsiaceae bacterium]